RPRAGAGRVRRAHDGARHRAPAGGAGRIGADEGLVEPQDAPVHAGTVTRRGGRLMGGRWSVLAILAFCGLAAVMSAQAAVKPRTILIVPFEATGLSSDEQWIGEGVAQALSLGLVQSPAFVQVDRTRLRTFGQPEAWGEPAVLQAARSLKVDAALYGRVARVNNELVLQPSVMELRGGAAEPTTMEPVTVPDGDLLTRLATLPTAYARTLKLTLTDAEARRMEKAAAPTKSLR